MGKLDILTVEVNMHFFSKFNHIHPEITNDDFNKIIQKIVDCFASLIDVFKSIPKHLKQIGVENPSHGKDEIINFNVSIINSDIKDWIIEIDLMS